MLQSISDTGNVWYSKYKDQKAINMRLETAIKELEQSCAELRDQNGEGETRHILA